MSLTFALLIACINQLNAIIEHRKKIAALIAMNLEMMHMLVQQRFLISSSFFFEVPVFFDVLPFLIVATPAYQLRTASERVSFSNYHYWEIVHPYLTDDDNPRTSFRSMYRMNRSTFQKLVNDLSQHPEYQLTAPNALPVYIQISCAVWRLANAHLGYRTMNVGWGVSHGSYINMTRRFVNAVQGIYRNAIKWPTEEEKVREIQEGFQHPYGEFGPQRLPGAIGALDGKNIVIEAPSPPKDAEYWRNRKGKFSVKLTAVCDHACRFTFISVGDSGIYLNGVLYKFFK